METVRENDSVNTTTSNTTTTTTTTNSSPSSPSTQRQQAVIHPFRCEMCDVHFVSRSNLTRHMRRKHKSSLPQLAHRSTSSPLSTPPPPPLSQPPVPSSTSPSTISPQQQQLDAHPILCELCGKLFTRQTNLTRHRNEVHSSQTYFVETEQSVKCKACPLTFDTLRQLSAHFLDSHTEPSEARLRRERTERVAASATMTSHSEVEDPPLPRQFPETVLVDSTSSSVGSADAAEVGKFHCPLCPRTMSSLSNLRRHSRTVHNQYSWMCRVCDERFPDRVKYRKHWRAAHGDNSSAGTNTPTSSTQRRQRQRVPLAEEIKGNNGNNLLVFEDDLSEPPAVDDDAELTKLLTRYWPAITTRLKRRPVTDLLNVRLWSGVDDGESFDSGVWGMLRAVWRESGCRVKVNCSIGAVLEHKTSGELRYFHSSFNNAALFPSPRLISTEADLWKFYTSVRDIDLREEAAMRRPNTAWTLRFVSNATFCLYKMTNMGQIGHVGEYIEGEGVESRLPDYILNNRHLLSLEYDHSSRGGATLYTDKLCFFRCLALQMHCKCPPLNCSCRRPREMDVRGLFREYAIHEYGEDIPPSEFEGVTCEDLLTLEKLFDILIVVFSLRKDGSSTVEWTSGRSSGSATTRLNVNLYDDHFSWVKNVEAFSRSFSCAVCGSVFDRYHNLKRHRCPADKRTELEFPGGEFRAPHTVFTRLKALTGIDVKDPNLLFYPYRMMYDIECFLPTADLPGSTETVTYTGRHELLSISVCTNIPDFTRARCFVRRKDESVGGCVSRFVEYLADAADKAGEMMLRRASDVLDRLERMIEETEEREMEFEHCRFTSPSASESRKMLCGIGRELRRHLAAVPVVGFNSQKYDLNIMKGPLLRVIQEVEGADFTFLVKRTNDMTCVESQRFRFMDICNFIAPGFNYSRYLKAFGCSEEKGFFPYEWVDSLEKLDHPCLPPKESFYSSLRREGISDEDYAYCQDVWVKNGMTSFRDFLVWYNNLDVIPFVEAVERQSAIYRKKGIDMLKSAISLPGLAIRWLFTEVEATPFSVSPINLPSSDRLPLLRRDLKNSQPVMLMDERNKDLFHTIRSNLVGGPSIIFHRYHEKGVTRIRHASLGKKAKLCQKVLGVDANALYLYCMSQDIPTGYPRRRREENDFAPDILQNFSKVAHGWLEYQAWKSGERVEHEQCGGERRLGRQALPVDGFTEKTRTAYQFHGCFWHGHPCSKTAGITVHPVRKEKMETLYERTLEKEEYVRSLGFTLVSVWECEWEQEVNNDPSVKSFLRITFDTLYPSRRTPSVTDIVRSVASGRFYGLIECDISVPPQLEEKFAEMAPVFKNTLVSREHLSEHMATFAQGKSFLKRPQRMLVGSLFGEKVLLLSDLAKWYLEQGLVITRVYQVVEYIPRRAYENFSVSVSNARRAGDVNPDLALLASTSKLVGNSAYGKTITNKEKHKTVKYVEGRSEASARVRGRNFNSLVEVDEDFYELTLDKSRLRMDTPVIVGFVILQLAKLRMLQFYYDFMDRYVERCDFEYVEMDTDSAYMALSGPTLESVIKPHMRREFYSEYGSWFPRPFCEAHRAEFISTGMRGGRWERLECCEKVYRYDTRTPGLFKEEFEGDGIVALNSKTYFCWSDGGDTKYSSKGLSKRSNRLTRECFLNVLRSGESKRGVNTGFVRRDNKTYTYEQLKTGLTYFYAKRKVLADGVSTTNIEC